MRKRLLYKLIPNRPTLTFDLSFSLHLCDYRFDMYEYLTKHSKVMHTDSPLARPRRYGILINHVAVSLIETCEKMQQGVIISFSMHVQSCYSDAIKQIRWFYMLRDAMLKHNLLIAPSSTKVYIKYHYIRMQKDDYIDLVTEHVGAYDLNKMLKAFKKTIWKDCIVVNH